MTTQNTDQTRGGQPPLSLFPVGTRVIIRPEWRDSAHETGAYIVTGADEGKGRVDIAPTVWAHGSLRPVETVGVEMIEAQPMPTPRVRTIGASEAHSLGIDDIDIGATALMAEWPDCSGWYVRQPDGEFYSQVFNEDTYVKTEPEIWAWLYERVEVMGSNEGGAS